MFEKLSSMFPIPGDTWGHEKNLDVKSEEVHSNWCPSAPKNNHCNKLDVFDFNGKPPGFEGFTHF